jgi:replicative DNA helicase
VEKRGVILSILSLAEDNYDKAQRVLIGHLLIFPVAASDVFTHLKKEHVKAFNVPVLARIFMAMESLYCRGVEISGMSIGSEISRTGGSTTTLTQVLIECSDAADREYRVQELGEEITDYVRELLDGYYLRFVKDGVERAETYPDVIKVAEHAIALDAGNRDGFQRPVDEVVDELIDVQTAIAEGRRSAGYEWGIPTLDDAVLIRPGKLYTVAAQKGAGKTKFLLSVINHALSQPPDPVPCLLFSLELSDLEVIKYLASRRAEVDSSLIFSRSLPDVLFDDIKLCTQSLRKAHLEIDTSPSISVRQIISRIRHWKIKYRVPDDTGIVGIDFLQLVLLDRRGGQLSEATALKNVAYQLAGAAKRLRVSIVAVAQLNKQADGTKPAIGYIEGSGGLAQASQCVLLLDLVRLRDESSGRKNDDTDELNIIIAKNRDGESMVTVPCRADLSIGRFYDRDPKPPRLIN